MRKLKPMKARLYQLLSELEEVKEQMWFVEAGEKRLRLLLHEAEREEWGEDVLFQEGPGVEEGLKEALRQLHCHLAELRSSLELF